MSLEKSPPRVKRSVSNEEEKAWVAFYKRVENDPSLATEVLAQLDGDAELKRAHLALYLCCKESLRNHKDRRSRNQRIGQFVRWLGHALLVRTSLALLRALRQLGDILVACLPGSAEAKANEPAVAKARQLAKEPVYVRAHSEFQEHQAPTPTLTPTSIPTPALTPALPPEPPTQATPLATSQATSPAAHKAA